MASLEMIDRKAQAESIAEIEGHLRMYLKAFDGPMAYRLLLEHGAPYYMTDKTFKGWRGAPKCCFHNALTLVLRKPGLTYVEGILNIGLPIEHAWCTDGAGRVIDPTLRPGAGDLVPPQGYFGIPFARDYVRRTALETRVSGIITYTNQDFLCGKVPPDTFLGMDYRKH
jgi:hypothetical protein